MRFAFVAAALVLGACSSGGAGTTGSSSSSSASVGSSSGGTSSTGSTSGGTTTGLAGPMLSFSPDPVTYLPDGGGLQDVFITSLSGQPVSTNLTFVFVPDAGGTCAAFDQGVSPEGGGSIALTCDLIYSKWSISANAAGTVVTIESMLDSNGDVTCGSLYYSCAANGDCCQGFDCQAFDAGPARGEVQACYYSWPGN